MKNLLTKKGIVLTVIVLLVAASIVPSIGGNNGMIRNVSENIREQESFLGDPPEEEWNHTFDGPGDDKGKYVIQTTDGGYICLCDKIDKIGDNRLNSDIWLIKTNAYGYEQWNRTYGGSNFDLGNQVQQTQDGGYIILGTIQLGSDSGDFWLIKTDSEGIVQWSRIFGGPGGDSGESVLQVSDGGYIIAGQKYVTPKTTWDAWLIKTNETGVEEWNHTYGGYQIDGSYDVKETLDGGYILCGCTCSFVEPSHMYDPYDAWLIKTNSEGVEQWNHSYGTNRSYEWGFSVQQLPDSGFIVAGMVLGDGKHDGLLIRTDESGAEIWNRSYGEINPGIVTFFCINLTYDGDFIICGGNGYFDPQKGYLYDIWVLKTDCSGDILWEKKYGEREYIDIGLSIAQTANGGYIITGGIETKDLKGSAAILIKLSPENQAPFPPSIVGETNGKPGTLYPYTFTSIDPDGDQVSYYIEWGDGDITDWTGFQPSGEPYSESNTWATKGTYIIRAKAKDTDGFESDWGTLEVTMPKNKPFNFNFNLLSWLFERFPNAFPILRQLLGL